MRELPIPFTGPMVKAILKGRKTMIRRVIKFPPDALRYDFKWTPREFDTKVRKWIFDAVTPIEGYKSSWYVEVPYQVGDKLWVKESYRISHHENGDDCPCYKVDNLCQCGKPSQISVEEAKWKSGRFMFKKYARIWLEVTAVKAEQLQSITPEDCKAEGSQCSWRRGGKDWEDACRLTNTNPMWAQLGSTYKLGYQILWDSINGKAHPWESNPWVWVYPFRRIAK